MDQSTKENAEIFYAALCLLQHVFLVYISSPLVLQMDNLTVYSLSMIWQVTRVDWVHNQVAPIFSYTHLLLDTQVIQLVLHLAHNLKLILPLIAILQL